MPESTDIADLIVRLRADVAELRTSMEAGRKVVQEKTGEMKSHFDGLKKDIAQTFAAEKMRQFFMAGLDGFAEFDKQASLATMNLKRFGQATSETKSEIAAWAEEMEGATLFNKTEVVTTLNKLVTMTHDYSASLRLSKLAMDVSSASGLDLQSTALALGNAFEGNTEGLGRFVRNFPGLKRVLDEGGDALGYLRGQVDGMSEAIGNDGLAGLLFHARDAWSDLSENFARDNEGALKDAIAGIRDLADWVGKAVSLIMKLAQTWGLVMGRMAADATALWAALKGNFREAIETSKGVREEFKRQLDEIWKKSEDTGKKAAKALSAGPIAAKAAWKDTAKEMKDAEKEQKKALDAIEDRARDMATGIASASREAASAMAQAYREGALTTEKAFEALGRAIFKSLVKSIGEALVQAGASDIATGMANLLNPVLAPAAPGFFLSGAAKSASGGTIVGIAEAALAEGGYVDRPTIALIGERGPEKVTPLSGGHPMDDGGGVKVEGGVHLHMHGVKDAQDAMSAGRARQAGHGVLTALDAEQRRQGVRKKRGGR